MQRENGGKIKSDKENEDLKEKYRMKGGEGRWEGQKSELRVQILNNKTGGCNETTNPWSRTDKGADSESEGGRTLLCPSRPASDSVHRKHEDTGEYREENEKDDF